MVIAMRVLYLIILIFILSIPMITGKVFNIHITNNDVNIDKEYNISNTSKMNINITIEGYKVFIKTDGKIEAYVDNITLNTIMIKERTYVLSPVVLNRPIHIYVTYQNKTFYRRVLLNYSYKDPYLHVYVNRSGRFYKVIVVTNGKLEAAYKDLPIKVRYKRISKDEYIVYPVILNNTLIVTSYYKNCSLRRELFLNFDNIEVDRAFNFRNILEELKKNNILISYDPSTEEIVIKVVGDRNYLKMFYKYYEITTIDAGEELPFYEIKIPLDKYNSTIKKELLKIFNIPDEVLNTSVKTFKINESKIRVEVENKLDNVWYRFSVKINNSKGYRIKEIVGDDGRVIVNNITVDRETGKVYRNIGYYIENDTLYFYDDPVYGYNISLIPPAPHNSIAIEIASNNDIKNEGGQISAIIFPYNEGDDYDTIKKHDHAGRIDDYNYGNEIDEYAGSKIAIRYSCDGETRQYGNGGRYFLLGDYHLRETYREYVYDHETPDGILESLIITKISAPWENRELNITQKIIIRDNYRWFATVYYIRNPTTKTFTNLKFFQGMDWNFNGDHRDNNCYYNSTYDIVYGYDTNASSGGIAYGGYRSILPSYEHEVNFYWDMWSAIKMDNLSNRSSFQGDAATAFAWYKDTLDSGETWVIPIVWGLGFNYSDMINQIEIGLNKLYDTGIKSINYPYNEEVFNPDIRSKINLTFTVALYGIVDVENLNVSVEIERVGGGYNYSNYTLINLSVPYKEEKVVVFPVNISDMPYGIYNIKVKTNLPNDQNISNDEKSVKIYIYPFSVEPDIQDKISKSGDRVYYNITLYNYYGNNYYFDINITNSTKGWPTYLYDRGILIGKDEDGDGVWDYILNDNNSNNLPDICINRTKNITVVKEIPFTTPLGVKDITTLEFVNTNITSIRDSTTFRTSTSLPPTVQKTFYLHGGINRKLNTSHPVEYDNYTRIGNNKFQSWVQSPKFSDNFTVYGNISIKLYMRRDCEYAGWHTVLVSLYATDGSSVIDLGSRIEPLYLSNLVNLYTFNITLDSPVTIPKNYYLVLKIDNMKAEKPLRIYHDINYPSNIALNTTTYIKIQDCYFDKDVYYQGDNATIYVNITDPIGAYDISGAEIKIYHLNGTLIYNSSMNLEKIDSSTLQLWKLYNYSFYLSDPGIYNITVTAIESNGVICTQNYYLLVRYYQNISISIVMTSNGYKIYLTSYTLVRDMYIFWYKPENVEVLNISGDFDESGICGNIYWFRYYKVEPHSSRYISIETNISTVEILNIIG